jgi:hypothetical protein
MANLANDELLRRIEELETENSVLRVHEASAGSATAIPAGVTAPPVKRKRSWAWTLLATVLITVGAILAPLAVVASWARVTLTDTDRFVAVYAPLADDPQVQSYVIDETVSVINEQIDIPQLTAQVIDGVIALGTGPQATRALELLKGPTASGVQSLIESGVTRFVTSDAFADVWASALRVSHSNVTGLLENDPNSAVTIGADGSIGIELGPIVEAAKTALIDQGIDLAQQIPSVDRTIVVAQSDALPTVQLAYNLTVAAGTWLPVIALLLLALGVVVARRRVIALIWAACALAVAMAFTLAAFGVANLWLISMVSPALLPSGVANLFYETVAGDMRATTVAVLVLAVVVALVAWFAGPFRVPRRLRGFAVTGAASIRGAAERHGLTTGRFGVWLYTRRTLLRALVAIGAAAVVLFVRPLTTGLTIWTLIIAALVIAVLEILQRPVVTVPAEAAQHDEVPVVSAT